MFLFHGNNTGQVGDSEEQRGKRKEGKVPDQCLTVHIFVFVKVSSWCLASPSCPVTGSPALLSCGHAHQHCRCTGFAIPLHSNSLLFSQDFLFVCLRRGKMGGKK